MTIGSNFSENFEWDLVMSYLMGGVIHDHSQKMIRSDIMLDHLRYVLNSDKYEKKGLYLQIFKLLLLSNLRKIRSFIFYGKKR